MELTPFQRKTLESWRRMKPGGPTWGMGLRRLAPTWGLLAVLSAAVYLIRPEMWMLVVGFLVAVCLRDLGYLRSARAVWPVSLKVIDWARVDELLTASKNEVR